MNKRPPSVKLPAFYTVAGSLLALLFLYLSIRLQLVNPAESCSAETLEARRGSVLLCTGAALCLFLLAVLRPRRATLLLLLAGALFTVPQVQVFSRFCGHESYAAYAACWLLALILWWVMSLIRLGTTD